MFRPHSEPCISGFVCLRESDTVPVYRQPEPQYGLLQEDTDLDADLWPEEDTAAKLRPEQIRPLYEAALREYLGKGTDQNAMLDAAPDAGKAGLLTVRALVRS